MHSQKRMKLNAIQVYLLSTVHFVVLEFTLKYVYTDYYNCGKCDICEIRIQTIGSIGNEQPSKLQL